MSRFERIILKGYWLDLLAHLVRIITLGRRQPDYQIHWLGKAMCALAAKWRRERTSMGSRHEFGLKWDEGVCQAAPGELQKRPKVG